MTTIYRGLMGTQPRANLTAMRQRVQQQPVGMPRQPQATPAIQQPSGINPNVPPPITKRISLRSQGNAAQPIGATSAINPSVPGIETPDAAKAPRLMGGVYY